MNTQGNTANRESRGWTSLDLNETVFGYTVTEAGDRFQRELMVEGALRIVGMMFMLAAYGQLFLPAHLFEGGVMFSHAFIMISLTTVGITIYAFATRGFRGEFGVNLSTREARIARLNGSGHSRITTKVPFDQIESFYVKRNLGAGQAALYIRKKTVPQTVCLLRGREAEVEALHKRLCTDIRFAAPSQAKARPPLFGRQMPA